MQISGYDKTAEHVTNFINNLEAIINSIKEYDRNIKIIINMPVPGADQNAWGMRSCLGSGKRYNYNMMQIGKAIIEKYGEEKNIFISPMAICIDTIYGFSSQETPAMLYTEKAENHQNNWVHPQRAGYCQMGDALAAVIEKIRE